MKKYLFLALLLGSSLFAAPVGNTAAPALLDKGLFIPADSLIDIRVGYEGDFVSDGRMGQVDQGSGRVDSYTQMTNSGTVTLNLAGRMDLYGVFGVSNMDADWRYTDDSAGNISRIELESENAFLWAVSGRAILFEWSNLYWGVNGRYSSSHYNPKSMTSNGASVTVAGGEIEWNQWQVGSDLAYKIKIFTPYIGVKYLNAKTFLNGFSVPISNQLTTSNTFKTRNPVGVYVGCGLSSGDYFFLNLEGRLVDEEAVTVSADFRF